MLSIYRTESCSESELWTIYQRHVESSQSNSIGTARTLAEDFYAEGLSFDPDGVPHPRHANVIRWPLGADQKEQLKDIKQALADRATFVGRPANLSP